MSKKDMEIPAGEIFGLNLIVTLGLIFMFGISGGTSETLGKVIMWQWIIAIAFMILNKKYS